MPLRHACVHNDTGRPSSRVPNWVPSGQVGSFMPPLPLTVSPFSMAVGTASAQEDTPKERVRIRVFFGEGGSQEEELAAHSAAMSSGRYTKQNKVISRRHLALRQ